MQSSFVLKKKTKKPSGRPDVMTFQDSWPDVIQDGGQDLTSCKRSNWMWCQGVEKRSEDIISQLTTTPVYKIIKDYPTEVRLFLDLSARDTIISLTYNGREFIKRTIMKFPFYILFIKYSMQDFFFTITAEETTENDIKIRPQHREILLLWRHFVLCAQKFYSDYVQIS